MFFSGQCGIRRHEVKDMHVILWGIVFAVVIVLVLLCQMVHNRYRYH